MYFLVPILLLLEKMKQQNGLEIKTEIIETIKYPAVDPL